MSTVTIRSRARNDIAKIWDYIAADSEMQADALVDRINEEFLLLAVRPGIGRSREVVRVLHGARDVASQFFPNRAK